MTTNAAVIETKSLNEEIAGFYDQWSGAWEAIWGDHMHNGFYKPGSDVSLSGHCSAKIRLIEESLSFASLSDDSVQKPKSTLDVGCGLGGSSRYLTRKYGATSVGITLSPVQVKRAQELTAAQGLDDKVSFQVADALNQPFPDGQFDLVLCVETAEYIPDKTKFVNELARVTAPGGTIIIITWCHRDLSPSEESLLPEEKDLLNRICDAYQFSPAWCSIATYVKLLQSLPLEDIKAEDWGQNVVPFWPAVIESALSRKGSSPTIDEQLSHLISGCETLEEALALPVMIEAYEKGLSKYAIITCRKPAS